MKILLLAPHPFYQERGTPIAVNLLLKALSERGDKIDVLTYHIGADTVHANVAIHRIARIPFVKSVRPGFSFKKIVCDIFMFRQAVRMARKGRYDVVHAVEESVFIAGTIRRITGTPYVCDMDSSMPLQICEKSPLFRILLPVMRWLERRAIRSASAVAAVCDSLADIARGHGAGKVIVLNDISLLTPVPDERAGEIRAKLDLSGVCFMYVGNLESYQGIDLLLESFCSLLKTFPDSVLVIAGGDQTGVKHCGEKARSMGIGGKVRLIGTWPVDDMASLLSAADILVSPRIKGNNTPMKIYSYLDSGKPILATDIPSHTQVLTRDVSVLAAPEPAAFGQAMASLAKDPALRAKLGGRGKALAQEKYCFNAYRKTIVGLYEWLEAVVVQPPATLRRE